MNPLHAMLWLQDDLAVAEANAMQVGEPDELEKPWVLFGSAVLLLHGLRKHIGDVDLFVRRDVWMELATLEGWQLRRPEPDDPPFLERVRTGRVVHAFHSWTDADPEVDARQCRRAAEMVGGWWCTPLQIIRLHKSMSPAKHPDDPRQAKHVADLAAIDEHLRRAA